METATDARDEVKCDLFLEVLRSFGSARLRVTGTSMLPSIWPGDILEVGLFPLSSFESLHQQDGSISSFPGRGRAGERLAEARDSIQPGELVLYERSGRFFAHRVVGAMQMPIADCRDPSRTFLVTRGDRLRQPDPPVSPQELVGRVKAIVRGGRRILPRRTWWGRAVSWVLCRSDVSTGILLRVRKTAASL